MGSYTNIPIVQIPRFYPASSTPPNVNYHSDNIGIAFLEYRTKTNLKDTSKNLLIYFNITNGDILKQYLFPKTIPGNDHIQYSFNTAAVSPTSQSLSDFVIHYIYPFPYDRQYGIHFITWDAQKQLKLGSMINPEVQGQFGATSFIEFNDMIYLGGAYINPSDATKISPALIKYWGGAHEHRNYAFVQSGQKYRLDVIGNTYKTSTTTYDAGAFIDQIYPLRKGTDGFRLIGFGQMRNIAGQLIQSYDFMIFHINTGDRKVSGYTNVIEILVYRPPQPPFHTKKILLFNHNNSGRFSFIMSYSGISDWEVFRGIENIRYYDTEGREVKSSTPGAVFYYSYKNETTGTSSFLGLESYKSRTKHYQTRLGRACYVPPGYSTYCKLVGFKNSHPNAVLDTDPWKGYAYVATTTHIFEDKNQVMTPDCSQNFDKTVAHDPGVRALNGITGRNATAILIYRADNQDSQCFDQTPESVVDIYRLKTAAYSLSYNPSSTALAADCSDTTYTIAKSADYLTKPLTAPVWKNQIIKLPFKNQYDITPCQSTNCQQCPIIVHYKFSTNSSQFYSISYQTQSAYYDPSSDSFSIYLINRTYSSSYFKQDFYLVMSLNFDYYGNKNALNYGEQIVSPVWAEYYMFPSCKPTCLESDGTLIIDALYRIESLPKNSIRITCKGRTEEQLLNYNTDSWCFESMGYYNNFAECASTDTFRAKNEDYRFNWNFDTSEFPKSITNIFDQIEYSGVTKYFKQIAEESDSEPHGWATISGTLASMLTIPDQTLGKVNFSGTSEFDAKPLRLQLLNTKKCFFNDKRLYIPKFIFLYGKISIDNCFGQKILPLSSDEEILIRQQKLQGKISIVSSGQTVFKVENNTRCPIREYEVLDGDGQSILPTNAMFSPLYISEQVDSSKLNVSFNSDLDLDGQIAKDFKFQFKAKTSRFAENFQKYRIIIGCFEQTKVMVEFKEDPAYEFVQSDSTNLFKVISKPRQFNDPAQYYTLIVDLKKILTWSTDIPDCYQSKVRICRDRICNYTYVPEVTFNTTVTNETTGEVGDMIMKFSTYYSKLQYFYIVSEIPNGNNITSKIKINVCGQESVRARYYGYRKLRYTEKDEWLYIKRKDWISFSQWSDCECPIEKLQLCYDLYCYKTNYNPKQFSLTDDELGINLNVVQNTKYFWLQAITKGNRKAQQKFQLTVVKKPPKPNMAPRFDNGLGNAAQIKVNQGGTEKIEFASKKATDMEKNNIKIEITDKKPKFAEFDIQSDHFIVKVDESKINPKDIGKKTYTVVLSDDVSKSTSKYTFTIEVVEKAKEEEKLAEEGDADGEKDENGENADSGGTEEVQRDQSSAKASSSSSTDSENASKDSSADDSKEEIQSENLEENMDSLLGDESLGDLGDLGDLGNLGDLSLASSSAAEDSSSSTGSGGGGNGSGGQQPVKKKINPIDQAKLDYIMSILKKRAQEKENKANQAEVEEVEPPKILAAWIEETTNMGKVVVKFNQTLVKETMPKPEQFNKNLITMILEPAFKEDNFNATKYEFTWSLDSFDPVKNLITFQLDFYEPLQISSGSEQDTIIIKIKQPWLFQGEESKLFLDNQFTTIQSSIGKQMINDESAANLKGSAQAAAQALENATVVMFVGQILLKGVLKKLMGALVLLQVIIHMGVLSVSFPGNILLFNSTMRPIISFDIMKYLGELNKVIFSFDFASQKKMREDKMIPCLKDMGFQFTNSIINLGLFGQVIGLFLFLSIIVAPILLILSIIIKKPLIQKSSTMLHDKIFFQMIIEILQKGYMPILISVYLNYQCAIWTTSGEIFANYYALICFFITVVGLTGMILAIVFLPEEYLVKPSFKKRIGSLYKGIKIEYKSQKASLLVFIARRFLLIFLGLIMFDTPGIQAQAILLLNIFVLIFQAQVKPFTTVEANRLELINETFMILICYNLFFYSDWISEMEQQYELAWNHIYIISAMVVYNSLHVVLSIVHSMKLNTIKYLKLLDYKLSAKPKKGDLTLDDYCPSTEQMRYNKDNYQGKYRGNAYRKPFEVLKTDPKVERLSFKVSRLPQQEKLFQKIKLDFRVSKNKPLSLAQKIILQQKRKSLNKIIIKPSLKVPGLAIIKEEPEAMKSERVLEDMNDELDRILQYLPNQNSGADGDLEKFNKEIDSIGKMIDKL